MKQRILAELAKIEYEERVRILLAVESGSRAWGFPSADSDYDVRFVYVRERDDYLSLTPPRDVIERPIDDALDISGWDLQKALKLFYKSNPTLLEWLKSPISYCERGTMAEQLREWSPRYIEHKSCVYHYLHMATSNFRGYLQEENVRAKKYFYVIRPLLACQWMETYNEAPPIVFETLLTMPNLPEPFIAEVTALVERKKSMAELDGEPRNDVLHEWMAERIAYYEQYAKQIGEREAVTLDELNTLFLTTIKGERQ